MLNIVFICLQAVCVFSFWELWIRVLKAPNTAKQEAIREVGGRCGLSPCSTYSAWSLIRLGAMKFSAASKPVPPSHLGLCRRAFQDLAEVEGEAQRARTGCDQRGLSGVLWCYCREICKVFPRLDFSPSLSKGPVCMASFPGS